MTDTALPDGDYELIENSAWFSIGGFSVRISLTDEGVVTDVYKKGDEMSDSLASTYALNSDLEPEDAEAESEVQHEYQFLLGADIRAYGTVTITAPSLEAAEAILTPEYVAGNFEPNGSGSDDLDFQHPLNIFLISAMEDEEDIENFEQRDLPAPDWAPACPYCGQK